MPDYDARLEELLPRLEQLWAQLGAPIADQLAPGLTEAELSARERAAGLSLPAELRIWWGWHDGVRRLQPGTRLGLESLVCAPPSLEQLFLQHYGDELAALEAVR